MQIFRKIFSKTDIWGKYYLISILFMKNIFEQQNHHTYYFSRYLKRKYLYYFYIVNIYCSPKIIHIRIFRY